MQTIAADVVRSVVCVSVCVLVTQMYYAKTAESIEMPLGGADSCGQKEPCIKWSLHPHESGNCGDYPAYWKVLVVSAAVYAAKEIIQ